MVITSELTRELRTLEELVVDFVLPEAAKKQYQQGNVSKKELESHLRLLGDLSKGYIGTKSIKLSTKQLETYALYYLPVNFAKLAFFLNQGLEFSSSCPIRLLDYGCGPGTGSLAAAYSFAQPLEVCLSDSSSDCMAFASRLLKSYRQNLIVKQSSSISSLSGKSFDLIIAANVLAEVSETERKIALENLINLLDNQGYLLLLEPALKSCTQLLMQDRDRILASHIDFSVIFPCNRQSDCPMLKESADDWCHGELSADYWERPPLIKQLDALSGFNKHRVKYSGFLFQRNAFVKNKDSLRLLRPSTKNHPALLCGQQGLVRINAANIKETLLKRALKNGNSYQEINSEIISK